MRVYGLDFTSAPKKGKPLSLAECKLIDGKLIVDAFHEFGSAGNPPFAEYNAWLNGDGIWANESEWVAGIDFPFGMPLPAISHFGWAKDVHATKWQAYMQSLFNQYSEFLDFKEAINSWVYLNERSEVGNPIKVQFKRLTDQVAHSHSPLKVTNNPYPGAMLFRGCKALIESGINVQPFSLASNSGTQSKKSAIEAYPKLVAQKFIPKDSEFSELITHKRNLSDARQKSDKADTETRKNLSAAISELAVKARLSLQYKDAGPHPIARANRESIIEGLSLTNVYGVQLSFSDANDRQRCIADPKGDLVDSVLCAVQAAWSFTKRDQGWGVPRFKDCALQKQIAIEGWIVDPSLLVHFEQQGDKQ